MKQVDKVIILGAGLAGLTLAYKLLKKGIEVEIIEKDNRVGGLMQTFFEDGFYIDYGPHIYFKHNLPELRDLLGENIIPVNVMYGIGFKNRVISIPLNPIEAFLELPIHNSCALISSLIWHKLSSGLKGKKDSGKLVNAEKWSIDQFGQAAYRYFFKDYIPKVMGYPPSQISSDWGIERDRFYREHNLSKRLPPLIIASLFNRSRERRTLKFYYPAKGAYQIICALVDFVERNGGIIHLNSTIEKVILKGDTVSGIQCSNGTEPRKWNIEGDIYASTLPLPVLMRLINQRRGSSITDLKKNEKLSYRSLWLFYFILSRNSLADKVQIYFPEEKYIFKRIYEPKNLNPHMGENGKTAICVEVCYTTGDAISQMKEEEVKSLIIGGLSDFFRLAEGDILKNWSVKIPHAYAIYKQGYDLILKNYAHTLFQIENLVSFGRQGSFRYNFLVDRVMEAADEVAGFITSEKAKKEYLLRPEAKSIFF